jgi:hypothetical protein
MRTEDAYSIFKKYGFDVVPATSLGIFTDYDKLCDTLTD